MNPQMQRRINLGVIAATAIVPLPMLIILLLDGDITGTVGAAIALLVNGLLLLAYVRGWDAARYLVTVTSTLIIGFSLSEPAVSNGVHPIIFMAPAIALVLTSWPWVIGAAGVVYTIGAVRVGAGVYDSPEMIVSFCLVVMVMVLSRLSIDHALRLSDASAAAARAQAEQAAEARDLARRQADELGRRNEEQQALLDLVATLETPAVTIADGILMAPIIGHLDSRRAETLIGHLLKTITIQRSRLLILDISGVAMLDNGVAASLERLIVAVRLLGCDVTITGIAPAVANALSSQGIGFAGIALASTPQQALMMSGFGVGRPV
jgi:rsbT co-antagonist protein RsbR